MFIPLKKPLHGGTKVHFEFPVEGMCPEGGAYEGTCSVSYYPTDRLVNVADFQQKYSKSHSYAEIHADSVFRCLGIMLGGQNYLTVHLDITEAVDHGPLQITIEGYANG